MAELTGSAPSAPTGGATPASTPSSSPAVSSPSPSPSPAGSHGESNVSSSIDAILGIGGSAPATAPEPQVDAPATPEETPEGGSAATLESTPAVPAVATVPEPVQAESEDSGDDTDIEAAQDDAASASNLLDLKRPRGQRIYGGYKAYKAISEAIGQELTVESAKQHLEAFSDKLAMEHEFSSGDPQAQANFLHHWNSTNPQAMAGTASQMIDYFAQNNPSAYVAVAMPALNRYINQMYQRATAEANPDVQKALLYTARMMDWDINDKFRDDTALPKQADPAQSTAAELAALRQQLAQQGQSQQAQRAQQWNQALEQSNNSVLTAESEKALAPLKSTLSPRLFSAAQRDFEEAVTNQIAKDVEGDRIYSIRRSQAQNRLSREDITSLNSQFAQRVSRAVRAVAPSFLKEAGVAAKTQSTARHEALATSAAAGAAPNGTGAPVPQSIVPGNPRQFGSRTEAMESSVDALLGATSRR